MVFLSVVTKFLTMANEVYFDIPVQIADPLEKRISDAFVIYDHNNVNMVDARDIPSILRFLGCVPTEEEIKDIVKNSEFPLHPGDVHLSNFMPYVKRLLTLEKMKPSSAEELLEAFRAFDTQKRGYISKEYFIKVMTEEGEEITDEALKIMLKAAVDPIEDKVYYEVYINQLYHNPEDSVYDLAKKFGLVRKSDARKLKMKMRN